MAQLVRLLVSGPEFSPGNTCEDEGKNTTNYPLISTCIHHIHLVIIVVVIVFVIVVIVIVIIIATSVE